MIRRSLWNCNYAKKLLLSFVTAELCCGFERLIKMRAILCTLCVHYIFRQRTHYECEIVHSMHIHSQLFAPVAAHRRSQAKWWTPVITRKHTSPTCALSRCSLTPPTIRPRRRRRRRWKNAQCGAAAIHNKMTKCRHRASVRRPTGWGVHRKIVWLLDMFLATVVCFFHLEDCRPGWSTAEVCRIPRIGRFCGYSRGLEHSACSVPSRCCQDASHTPRATHSEQFRTNARHNRFITARRYA